MGEAKRRKAEIDALKQTNQNNTNKELLSYVDNQSMATDVLSSRGGTS